MGDKTKIAWCDATWNPIIGCSRVSPGCEHCYAERLSGSRLRHLETYGSVVDDVGRWNGRTLFMPDRLDQPMRWKRPRKIFVNDMGDTFHESVKFETIAALFGVMAACQQHTFQVLTKRPERMLAFFVWLFDQRHPNEAELLKSDLARDNGIDKVREPPTTTIFVQAKRHLQTFWDWCIADKWPLPNVWLGVTCEDQKRADERIPLLLKCPAVVRFVSAEPLLGPIDFRPWLEDPCDCGIPALEGSGQHAPGCRTFKEPWGLDWVIPGGESGPKARPCDVGWIRSIRDQCKEAGTPCFVKQMGSNPVWVGPLSDGCKWPNGTVKLQHLAGADPSEWPEDLRVREWPRRSA